MLNTVTFNWNIGAVYHTNFDDEIISMDWNESKLENDGLESYKAKAEFYIRQHQDNAVIAKLKSNIPLNSSDMIEYTRISLMFSKTFQTNFAKKQTKKTPLTSNRLQVIL